MGKNQNKPQNTAPKVNAKAPAAPVQDDRFNDIRTQYPSAEDFRASIEKENESTLRNSAKEFEIELADGASVPEILDTIVAAVYPAAAPEGDKPTPAHDDQTNAENQKAADQVKKGEAPIPPAGKNKKAMDSTTESAAAVPGAAEGDVIKTESPANPNENWTEPNEEKKKTLSARALAASGK